MSSRVGFEASACGKWILAGEHAVLRGSPALVFPVKHFAMKFQHTPGEAPLRAEFVGSKADELNLVFWGLIENALQKVGRTRADLTGVLTVESTLPLGAGLGASAALCVGVGRFFSSLGWVGANGIYEFSRELEGLFHGESSGVDIAVALEGRGLRFMRGGERVPVQYKWWPKFYLSYSGERGVTSDCVRRVGELRQRSHLLGDKIDQQMREAVETAERALQMDPDAGFTILADALNMARDCFYQWGLCDGPLDQHMREISKAGAFAVKPTGSGGGGYVLSLWQDDPPVDIKNKMIAL